MFVLKVWSGGWQDVAKDESAGVLMTRAIGLGSIGAEKTSPEK